HGALFVASLPEIRLEQVSTSAGSSTGLSATFQVSRTGDVSLALPVYLSITDSSIASSTTTEKTVTIPAGASSVTASLVLAASDSSKQNVVVSVQPDPSYNVQPNILNTAVQVLSLPLPK
ncbi:MAG: hypothetical protein WBZ19_17660, partial [Chthoniobacterales bacterium]